MDGIIKNKRGLELVTYRSSGHKTGSKIFLYSLYISDQVWWCNVKQLLSYSKNYICKFIADTSFKVAKQTHTKRLERSKKEILLFLITENIAGRKLSLCKTIKYQLNMEKKVKGVSRIKYFKRIIFLIACQSCTFLLMNIMISFNHNSGIVQRKISLRNLTLITSHLTVLLESENQINNSC